jgi:hypothetical protein
VPAARAFLAGRFPRVADFALRDFAVAPPFLAALGFFAVRRFLLAAPPFLAALRFFAAADFARLVAKGPSSW